MAADKGNESLMGAASYLLGWVTGVIFLLVEKQNKFVRFHAMQSIVVSVGLIAASFVLGMIPLLNLILVPFMWLGGFVLWIVLMYKAFQGELYKLPKVGDLADQLLAKLGK